MWSRDLLPLGEGGAKRRMKDYLAAGVPHPRGEGARDKMTTITLAQAVQSDTSDFGFEMQDSFDFKISPACDASSLSLP